MVRNFQRRKVRLYVKRFLETPTDEIMRNCEGVSEKYASCESNGRQTHVKAILFINESGKHETPHLHYAKARVLNIQVDLCFL